MSPATKPKPLPRSSPSSRVPRSSTRTDRGCRRQHSREGKQPITDNDNDHGPEDVTGERTSAFRADFTNEQDAAATAAEAQLFGAEALPQGTALLVVKRGPNAGSRFLLDQPTTTAGRHPTSDTFLDDITISRRHAQFRCVGGEFQVVDVGSLNGTYVNREPVDSAVLANGDEVQIGKFRLVFLTGPTTGDTESVTS